MLAPNEFYLPLNRDRKDENYGNKMIWSQLADGFLTNDGIS
jgi:hypothetical protein